MTEGHIGETDGFCATNGKYWRKKIRKEKKNRSKQSLCMCL